MTAGSRTLTVLHVNTERGWRGGERQTLWLAEALARMGHRSLLAARPREPLAARAAERGLTVIPCSPLFEFDPATVVSLRRTILREAVDVVHAHTGHAVALVALCRFKSRARMVLTRRVVFPLRGGIWSRWKYERADAIIAISAAVARALEAGGIRGVRIDVVPSGIDASRQTAPASRETLASLGIAPDSPLVVMVAALGAEKDPLTFVRAIAAAKRSVPSIHALLVGDGPLRSRIEAEIRRLGLDHTLRLTGYRKDADSLIAAAKVVALSSKQEGLGTVLIDAIAFGRPVAATAAGGIPEILGPNQAGGLLVPVGDDEQLGLAIARILSDENLARRLSASGLARAAHFSIERTAEMTEAVYARVVGSHPS